MSQDKDGRGKRSQTEDSYWEEVAELTRSSSQYWTDVKLKREAILEAIKDGLLPLSQIKKFTEALKNMEN